MKFRLLTSDVDVNVEDADVNHWNEILHWDDDCDLDLMIAAPLAPGGPNRICEICKHPTVFCPKPGLSHR